MTFLFCGFHIALREQLDGQIDLSGNRQQVIRIPGIEIVDEQAVVVYGGQMRHIADRSDLGLGLELF